MRTLHLVLTCVVLGVGASLAWGDDDPPVPPAAEPAPHERPRRDPTDDGSLRPPARRPDAAPGPVAVRPTVTLKALVQVEGREATALLQIGTELRRVVPGETVHVVTTGGRVATVEVLSVGPDDVRLRHLASGEMEVVR